MKWKQTKPSHRKQSKLQNKVPQSVHNFGMYVTSMST